MSNLLLAIRYLKYLLQSKTEYDLHSPFVFDLYTKVIADTTPFYIFDDIENLRAELLLSNQLIAVTDYGAGSKIFKSNQRKIKDIAKYALKTPKYSQLLFRLINNLKPKTIIELGTSLGVSSLYLASPSKKAKMITLEGCPETAKVAKQNFEKLDFNTIETIVGNFDQTLSIALKKMNEIDCVFFDGNHKKEPTLKYFHESLSYINEKSFFIFDDIHWSKEMEKAWSEIKQHKQVTLSIDLFQIGIVFFREMPEKQDFVLRY